MQISISDLIRYLNHHWLTAASSSNVEKQGVKRIEIEGRFHAG